jgi:hypothetical protein
MAKKKKARKKKPAAKKKAAAKKRALARGKKARAKKPKRAKPRLRGPNSLETPSAPAGKGLGPGSGGQSGDIQGISRAEDADSESVEELAEEGQAYEAEVVSGVEDALDPDQGEVHTHESGIPGEEE